jgi:hypothetical protein
MKSSIARWALRGLAGICMLPLLAQAHAPWASLMPAEPGGSGARHIGALDVPASKFTLEPRCESNAGLPLTDKHGGKAAEAGTQAFRADRYARR